MSQTLGGFKLDRKKDMEPLRIPILSYLLDLDSVILGKQ